MAQNLNESSTYETNVPSIETVDDVVGSVPAGDPNLGIANGPHVKLANRTKYLKTQVDAHDASITALQGVVVALDAGKANILNETHEGEHKFEEAINREFVPVPSSQARAVKAWEMAFGLEDIGNGIAALTSKNLIEAVAGIERLKYTDHFGVGLSGILVYHNTFDGATGFYYTDFQNVVLIFSQDPTKPYTLIRLTKNLAVKDVKSKTYYYPTNSHQTAKWLAGTYQLEVLETALDGGGSDEAPIIIGAFSDFAGGQQEGKIFIRNGHNTGKIDYLQGWIRIRALPKLITTV